MRSSVEYLGHIIDAEGIHATTKKDGCDESNSPSQCFRIEVILGAKLLWKVSAQSLNDSSPTKPTSTRCHSTFKLMKDTLHSAQELVDYNLCHHFSGWPLMLQHMALEPSYRMYYQMEMRSPSPLLPEHK